MQHWKDAATELRQELCLNSGAASGGGRSQGAFSCTPPAITHLFLIMWILLQHFCQIKDQLSHPILVKVTVSLFLFSAHDLWLLVFTKFSCLDALDQSSPLPAFPCLCSSSTPKTPLSCLEFVPQLHSWVFLTVLESPPTQQLFVYGTSQVLDSSSILHLHGWNYEQVNIEVYQQIPSCFDVQLLSIFNK